MSTLISTLMLTSIKKKKRYTAYLQSETACVTMSTCSCFDSWWFCAWRHACRNLSSKTCYPEAQKDPVGWCKQLTVHRGFTKGQGFMWSSSGIILRTFRGFFLKWKNVLTRDGLKKATNVSVKVSRWEETQGFDTSCRSTSTLNIREICNNKEVRSVNEYTKQTDLTHAISDRR